MRKPNAVICLWKWIGTGRSKVYENKWELVESYGTDDDGYCITPSKHAVNERHTWIGWTHKKKGDDWEQSIMGRAVTVWNIESGVGLIELHPAEWADLLSISFVEELRKLSNWASFLEGGHTLYLGTAREAEKFMGIE